MSLWNFSIRLLLEPVVQGSDNDVHLSIIDLAPEAAWPASLSSSDHEFAGIFRQSRTYRSRGCGLQLGKDNSTRSCIHPTATNANMAPSVIEGPKGACHVVNSADAASGIYTTGSSTGGSDASGADAMIDSTAVVQEHGDFLDRTGANGTFPLVLG